jgi:hypothetical protein
LTEQPPEELVPEYAEGDEIVHSSGHVYRRVNGAWTLIRYPDGIWVEGYEPTA